MKRIMLALVALLISVGVFAQNRWLNSSPFKLGIAVNQWKVNDVYQSFRYEQIDNVPLNARPLTPGQTNTFSNTRMPMVFENIGSNFHHETSVTGVWDILWDALTGVNTVYEGGPEARRFELFRTHWAGGGWIEDKIGLFGGVQYAYSTIRFQDPSSPDELIFGGNQRGFHVTGMYNAGPALLKTRVMYDWIRMSKGHQKGSGFTLDVQGYYSFNKSGSVGAFGGLQWKSLSQSGPSGTPTDEWKNQGIQNQGVSNFSYEFPDMSGTSFMASIGLYFSLLKNN